MAMQGRSIDKPFKSKTELKEWYIDNQPHIHTYIPDVVNYFAQKYGLK